MSWLSHTCFCLLLMPQSLCPCLLSALVFLFSPLLLYSCFLGRGRRAQEERGSALSRCESNSHAGLLCMAWVYVYETLLKLICSALSSIFMRHFQMEHLSYFPRNPSWMFLSLFYKLKENGRKLQPTFQMCYEITLGS